MKNGQGGRTQVHKRDDLDYWATLDAATKKSKVPSVNGKMIAGSTVRIQALEWLRLESVRLAYLKSPKRFLRMAKTQDHDIRHAFGRKRDELIEWPPRPVTWVYPYLTRSLKEALCLDVLAPEDIQVNRLRREQRSGRVIVSLDPSQSDRALESLRKYLSKHGTRGTGGRNCRLARLREALLSYEQWLNIVQPAQASGAQVHEPGSLRSNKAMRDIGKGLRSYEPPTKNPEDGYEKNAQKILSCARKMLWTALERKKESEEGKEGSKENEEELKSWSRQYR